MDIDIVDVVLSESDDGEPRVNLGDQATGVGFAAQAAQWGCGPAFVSIPNPPDSAGCTQAIQFTQGHVRCSLLTRDNRYVDNQGELGLGDAAITSNCDAGLILRAADNRITMRSTGMVVTCDGQAGQVTVAKDDAHVVVSQSGVTASWGPVGGVTASVSTAPGGVTLTYTAAAVTASIILGPGGTVAIMAPGGVTVNTIPLVVP